MRHTSVTPARNGSGPICGGATGLDVAADVEVLPVGMRNRCRRDEVYRFVLGCGHDGNVTVLNLDVQSRIVAHDAPAGLRQEAKDGASDIIRRPGYQAQEYFREMRRGCGGARRGDRRPALCLAGRHPQRFCPRRTSGTQQHASGGARHLFAVHTSPFKDPTRIGIAGDGSAPHESLLSCREPRGAGSSSIASPAPRGTPLCDRTVRANSSRPSPFPTPSWPCETFCRRNSCARGRVSSSGYLRGGAGDACAADGPPAALAKPALESLDRVFATT